MQRECREIPSLPTIKLLPVLGRDDSFIRGANNVDIICCGNDNTKHPLITGISRRKNHIRKFLRRFLLRDFNGV